VAFASFSWVLAHSLAMVAFVLLALGLLGQYIRLQETTVENRVIQALVLSWIRIGLTLPYYGAETFGLHAIGQEAIKQKNPALLSIVDSFGRRGCVIHTRTPLSCSRDHHVCDAIWGSSSLPAWIGIPMAIGFALYIPQFFELLSIRVAHGLLITIASI
jgi:hypothetical protein